jgi:tetratricopeptide (TPR) repeat protein
MTIARSHPGRSLLVFAALSAAAMLGSPAVLHADDVSLIPGNTVKQAIGGRVRGTVQSESPTEVVVILGTNSTTVPTEQIASIRYDGQSANFQLGESREAGGQLAEAADLFKKAAAEASSSSRPFPHQAALFREAQVLGELAIVEPERLKEARDKLNQFIRSYPGGRHIAAAREALARLQIHAGDFGGAEATIAALAGMPKGGERAQVLRTKVLARQGKHDQAIAELDRLIASSTKGSARQRAAMLAKAESLAASKRFKDAEELVRQVIQANPPEDAASQAPAYNTLGDCLRAANRPKEALIAYLHTDMLYNKDKEEHPRALHAISTVFRQLKQDARADEFAQRLRQEYPRSAWNRASSSEAQ